MQRLFNKLRCKFETGFTVVELVVVITVLGLLSPVVFITMSDLYSSNISSLGLSVQDTDTRSVLRSINDQLANATSWGTSQAVGQPLGPKNSSTLAETWSYCGLNGTTDCPQTSVNRVLIAYSVATDKALTDPARLPIFAQTNGSCDNSQFGVKYIKVAEIYFVAPDPTGNYNDLYRRMVLNPAGDTLCGGVIPSQKTTCAVSVSANSGCLDSSGKSHSDNILLTHVTSFNVDYYVTASDASIISSPYTADANTIAAAQSIKVTVASQVNISGKLTLNTANIRITPQN